MKNLFAIIALFRGAFGGICRRFGHIAFRGRGQRLRYPRMGRLSRKGNARYLEEYPADSQRG